ncbi:hypothetical protein [Anaerosporobacter faecicola]|uniref:hypothetical protein n=1 Tax=Anaerosporobacter faecicola TaxID=2718714 RepID=UPI00143BC93F|nr:hypothetical protein [Anaerosporobacter faecicola]
MTEIELRQYTSIKREIDDLEKRIEKEYGKEITAVAGKVKGSMRCFPYTEVRTSVLLEDPTELATRDKLIATREKKKKELEAKALEIETFINSIEESELRLIFRYRFIDGLRQTEVGNLVNLDRSRISRKISDYLQNAHKAQK